MIVFFWNEFFNQIENDPFLYELIKYFARKLKFIIK